MKITEIAFIGYPVTDLKRARAFYEQVLGLVPAKIFGDDQTAWIEYNIGEGTLAIGNVAPEWQAAAGGGCAGFEVDDFNQALERLKSHGVAFHPPMDTPVCRMVIVSDPDGNSLILHQRKS